MTLSAQINYQQEEYGTPTKKQGEQDTLISRLRGRALALRALNKQTTLTRYDANLSEKAATALDTCRNEVADRDAKIEQARNEIAEMERDVMDLVLDRGEEQCARLAAEAQVAELTQKLERATEIIRTADDAIAEYIRYLDGGEMRGSYDGRPEREGLWRAMYAARSTLSSLSPAPQPVGEVRCRITGNPVGTDTVRKGYTYPCSACSPASPSPASQEDGE